MDWNADYKAKKRGSELKGADLPTRSDDDGTIVFGDCSKFRPNLTPMEILRKGAFGGGYFRPIHSGVIHEDLKGDYKDLLPERWYKGMPVAKTLTSSKYRVEANHYKAKTGQSLEAWESSGWIRPTDPRGWFAWYCAYFLGRRTSDDDRQISRWFGVAGPKGRWITHLVKKIASGGGDLDDKSTSPVVRQLLLHWAYRLTESRYLQVCKRIGFDAFPAGRDKSKKGSSGKGKGKGKGSKGGASGAATGGAAKGGAGGT